jgi:hypothetical protein
MTCRSRSSRFGVAAFASVLLAPALASAAELPPIKTSETNQVAECATPGRLMLYVRQRNPKLDPRYEPLAAEYMRNGEALGIRWDYAFFQMLLETGYLTYGGDVKPDQNNFAGLGATGGGVRGERFKDIASGARAHIEHLVMYSGERVENPVAERTRNIQDWGVLTDWQKEISGPITFSQLAKKWAPGSKRYASDVDAIATRFFDGVCKGPDPEGAVTAAVTETPEAPAKTRNLEAKTKPVETTKVKTAKVEEDVSRLPPPGADAPAIKEDVLPAKGAAAVAASMETSAKAPVKTTPAKTTAEQAAQKQPAAAAPSVTVLNPSATADTAVDAAAANEAEVSAKAQSSGKSIEVAALPSGLASTGKGEAKAEQKPDKKSEKKPEKKEQAASGKCRVWTASYGGAKAIIIKAVSDKTINYTVLDVNEGAEKREADAYINAYAKGGQSVGEFSNQSQALEKAFELCPEG